MALEYDPENHFALHTPGPRAQDIKDERREHTDLSGRLGGRVL